MSKYMDDAAGDAGSDYDSEEEAPLPKRQHAQPPAGAPSDASSDASSDESENEEDRAFVTDASESEGEEGGRDIAAEADAEAKDAEAAALGVKQRLAEQRRLEASTTLSANAAALLARNKALAAPLGGGGTVSAALKQSSTGTKRAREEGAGDAPEAKRARPSPVASPTYDEDDESEEEEEEEEESEAESDDEEEDGTSRAIPALALAVPKHGRSEDKDKGKGKDEDEDMEEKAKTRRVTGNKTLADPQIPPKPAGMTRHFGVTAPAGNAPFDAANKLRYRIILTNPHSLLKFLSGVIKVIPEMRFHLIHTKKFQGFRIEAHDASLSLAAKSRYKCDLEVGVDADGSALDESTLNAISFCVTSETFALALDCAAEKEANMYITQYNATPERPGAADELAFETVADEEESCAQFYIRTITADRLRSLAGIKVAAAFHLRVALRALKSLCAQAKKARAAITTFCVERCADPDDPTILHSRMSIGFDGCIDGKRVFFTSMRPSKNVKARDGSEIVDSEVVVDVPFERRAGLDYASLCINSYDSKKLRLFLKNMEAEWCWVHLSPDLPLILEIATADKSTSHVIIVANKTDDETV